jgi:hypothetical protein
VAKTKNLVQRVDIDERAERREQRGSRGVREKRVVIGK